MPSFDAERRTVSAQRRRAPDNAQPSTSALDATRRGGERFATRQSDLPFRTWGGRRRGAGRKPKGGRVRVSHVARPNHKARHPVHVTLRAERRLPSLRRESVFRALHSAFAICGGDRFRLVHFSVQTDHVHLIVEAADKDALSRGASGLTIRLARAVNRVLDRHGRVWGDRYHARALCTPREMRHALVYVLTNWRKHVAGARGLDPCSSAIWFDGWKAVSRETLAQRKREDGAPISPPMTWLASRGWRRRGLIDVSERPSDSTSKR
jgi:putative transposase